MTGQRPLLPAQGGLIAEELARSEPQHRLISPVTLGADLDLPVDHDVVLTSRFTRTEDNLAGFVSQSVENGRNPALPGPRALPLPGFACRGPVVRPQSSNEG